VPRDEPELLHSKKPYGEGKTEEKRERAREHSRLGARGGAGWLVPGGGHLLLKRTGRGVLLLVAITTMFLCRLMMRGTMFTPQGDDLLTVLINWGGWVGNVASGILYLMSVWLGYAQPDVAGAVHDYGTKFLVTAAC